MEKVVTICGDLLGYVPSYLTELLAIISGPVGYLRSVIRMGAEERSSKASVFVLLSFFITWLLVLPFYQSLDAFLMAALSGGAMVIFNFIILMAAISVAWRVAGTVLPASTVFAVTCFCIGVGMWLHVILDLVEGGLLASIDAEAFAAWKNAFDGSRVVVSPQAWENVGTAINMFGWVSGIVYLTWYGIVWSALIIEVHSARRQKIIATFTFVFAMILLTVIVLFVFMSRIR